VYPHDFSTRQLSEEKEFLSAMDDKPDTEGEKNNQAVF